MTGFAPDPEFLAWLSDVEAFTEPHRLALARRHEAEVNRALRTRDELAAELRAAVAGSHPEPIERVIAAVEPIVPELANRIAWHKGRAAGQRERFDRLRACGEGTIRVTSQCGGELDVECRCAIARACVKCRAAAAFKRRARFARGRIAAVINARRLGLFRRNRHGGTWGERHLTLTVPHVLDTAEGVRAIFAAWRKFSIKLQAYFRNPKRRARNAGARPDYYRAFEWTPGKDGRGHPHFHVWLLSPFLPQDRLAVWWRAALVAAFEAMDLDPTLIPERVIVDVRAVATPKHFERELLKSERALQQYNRLELRGHVGRAGEDVVAYADGWSLAEQFEVDGERRRIDPRVAAELYAGLEGKRMAQSSRRFYSAAADVRPCMHCGANHEHAPRVVVLRDPTITLAEVRARFAFAERAAQAAPVPSPTKEPRPVAAAPSQLAFIN